MPNPPDPLEPIATWPDVAENDAISNGIPRDARFWEDTARNMAAWAQIHIKEKS